MINKKYNIAVAGATGAVGEEMRKILESRSFPVKEIRYMASSRSEGKILKWKDKDIKVEDLEKADFSGVDIALFSAGGGRSKKYAPLAASAGAVVIDNSSAFRMNSDVPLVVPEVNPEAALEHKGIIANPNCSTIQMVMALKPIFDEAGIRRIVVSTYQSVSGAGLKAVDELMQQTRDFLEGKEVKCDIFPHQMAFECIPQIPQSNAFGENGYTSEEMKLLNETRKILGDDSIRVTMTAVRVPVIGGHSEAVNIETIKTIKPERVRELLAEFPGVTVMDDPDNEKYPLANIAWGKDDVYVGRIRLDESIECGLNMWVVADNLRKGAALNAIQIAELL
ncbi:MAG: aspartate-semialdehyde dehydrogenase, partial [Elusimicrobiota bacterium]|nr:aspartate-semialdehyde dehydrogenase [Elusimicrobiota bacterium]